jgi:hypothetical protein
MYLHRPCEEEYLYIYLGIVRTSTYAHRPCEGEYLCTYVPRPSGRLRFYLRTFFRTEFPEPKMFSKEFLMSTKVAQNKVPTVPVSF